MNLQIDNELNGISVLKKKKKNSFFFMKQDYIFIIHKEPDEGKPSCPVLK